ncbi:hypothetical protein F4553_001720 [Allocatelliglobosispora scoriae]|uniref:Uncharacterized protein n=1 Tax=Allocatelliglobosispora scoriae TaxID=643052 RepID=A0A841BND8_9ACTN|nr:hypothetical protein [Allocatelliglobosispora scoriae]
MPLTDATARSTVCGPTSGMTWSFVLLAAAASSSVRTT